MTCILQDLERLMPGHLLLKLNAVSHLVSVRAMVEGARKRMALRSSQAPLQAEIRERCTRLNAKKAALDAKVNTSTDTARLETLDQELRAREEKVRATRVLIEQEKNSLATSDCEARSLSAELKDDIDALHGLSCQLVGGDDQEDEALIAGADQVRLEVIAAIEDYLR